MALAPARVWPACLRANRRGPRRWTMVHGTARRRVRGARYASRRASDSRGMELLARAGLAARGVMYVIIGWLALQIGFGHPGGQAGRSGALRLVAQAPFGSGALWVVLLRVIRLVRVRPFA